MSEEDTFQALKRTPFDIVEIGWRARPHDTDDQWVLDNGWTLDDFYDERLRRYR